MDTHHARAVQRRPNCDCHISTDVLADGALFSDELLHDPLSARTDEDTPFLRQIRNRTQQFNIFFARRIETDHRIEIEPREEGRGKREEGLGGENQLDVVSFEEFQHLGDGFGIDAVYDLRASGNGLRRSLRMVGINAHPDP